jgi:RNA polymerase sigma-70 factor (ECF subfamily)
MTEDMIRTHSPHVYRQCYFLSRNENDANDLFQETWGKVLRHIEKYDSARDFRKWVSAICVNTYRDMCRKNRRFSLVEFDDENEMETFFSALPDKDSENHTREEYVTLYNAIGALTPIMRTVIVLHYFSGYSEKECAQILGVSAGKVKSRLYSARQSIKRGMEQ